MDKIDLNNILNRKKIEFDFIKKLNDFELNKSDLSLKRGFFFYGSSGAGKTVFISQILKSLDYDIITYDSGDIRNKSIIYNMTKHNTSNINVLSMLTGNRNKIAIIMDEIDSMNNGDKGGISSLIKLIRAKKTKKQKQEDYSDIPIICVGNYHFDKKLTELKKVCNSYELKQPNIKQVTNILSKLIDGLNKDDINNIVKYIDGDLRKINSIYEISISDISILRDKYFNKIFQPKINNEFNKDITKILLEQQISISEHNILLSETDRTSISLLLHENIVDVIDNNVKSIQIYNKMLDSYCFSDYIDRITFQKQIWIFNEISSLLKSIYSNHLYFSLLPPENRLKLKDNIRFTKILTKYSTEYNNLLFLNLISEKMTLDKSDVISHFIMNKSIYETLPSKIYTEMTHQDISKLEVDRIYRFINNLLNIATDDDIEDADSV